MYIGDVEVTLREAIFSVTIASVLLLIGFFISTKIEHHVNQKNLEYRQAAQISLPDEFSQGMKTDIGNAFVQGKWEAVSSVKHPSLKGEWASIHANYQKYTMHTRVVTYTTSDGKGHVRVHHRTETYWTWDTYKTSSTNCPTVKYIGSEFPFKKFDYGSVGRKHDKVGDGFRKRIVFTMIPTNFNAAAYTTLKNGTVSNKTCLREGKSIELLYEDFTTSHANAIFWTLWIIFIVLAMVGFVVVENNWIEDDDEGKPKRRKQNYGYGYGRQWH